MNTIANLLLRIIGDTDDAQEDLRELARELAEFGRMSPEAEAQIDTGKARAELNAILRDLRAFAREVATAAADVNTEAAHRKIDRLRFRLEELDAVNVDPDVDLDIAGALAQLAALDAALDRAGRRGRGFRRVLGGMAQAIPLVVADMLGMVAATRGVINGLGNATEGLSTFGRLAVVAATLAGVFAAVLALLSTALTAVTSALGALAASAGFALAALGALATALGGAFAAAAVVGLGAIQRFAATSDIAGSAANRLKDAAGDLARTFQVVMRPAAIAVFRGITDAIQSVRGILPRLKGEFTLVGRAIGDAFRMLGEALTHPRIVRGLEHLLRSVAELIGPMTRGIVALGEILLNIANAAMPFLVSGADSFADALERWARGTRDTDKLRDTIGVLVGHLREWGRLAGGILRFVFGVFVAAAPAAKEFVAFLADGARSLAEWANSREGREQIKQFFDDTLPLVRELVTFIGRLLQAMIRFGQAAAPILTPVVGLLNSIISIVSTLLGWLGRLTRFLGGPLTTAFTALVQPVGQTWDQVKVTTQAAATFVVDAWNSARRHLSSAWVTIRSVASSVWGAIRGAISTAVNATTGTVTSAWNTARTALSSTWSSIRSAASSTWGAIRSAIRSAVSATTGTVRSVWQAARTALTSIWGGIRSAASSTWGAIRSAVVGAVDGARDRAVSIAANLASRLRGIWGDVVGAARSVLGRLRDAVSDVVNGALGAVRGLAGDFYRAGRALIGSIADGVVDAARGLYDKVRGIVRGIRNLLPFSEPKDPTSPLRGLGKSGAAIIENITAGLAQAGPRLLGELETQLSGLAATVAVTPAAAAAAVGPSVREGDRYDIHVNAPAAPAGFDARAAAMELAMLIRERGGLRV